MEVLAWIALFSPTVAVVAIALLGERITRYTAGLLAAGSTLILVHLQRRHLHRLPRAGPGRPLGAHERVGVAHGRDFPSTPPS